MFKKIIFLSVPLILAILFFTPSLTIKHNLKGYPQEQQKYIQDAYLHATNNIYPKPTIKLRKITVGSKDNNHCRVYIAFWDVFNFYGLKTGYKIVEKNCDGSYGIQTGNSIMLNINQTTV